MDETGPPVSVKMLKFRIYLKQRHYMTVNERVDWDRETQPLPMEMQAIII